MGGITLRATARGIAFISASLPILAVGMAVASELLLFTGAVLLATTVVSLVQTFSSTFRTSSQITSVRRTLNQQTLTPGQLCSVTTTAFHHGTMRSTPQFQEQAAAELSGERVRATVLRGPSETELHYWVLPQKRGRWELGPLHVTSQDSFGLFWCTRAVGSTSSVAVWPRHVSLNPEAFSGAGQAALHAAHLRSQSVDDAVLRDYRDGDDFRRIHWASSARRGEITTRGEDRAHRASVHVLFSLAATDPDFEWTVSLIASVATSYIGDGDSLELYGFGPSLHAHNASSILDGLVDLARPSTPDEARASLEQSLVTLRERHHTEERIIAILHVSTLADVLAQLPPGAHCIVAYGDEPSMDSAQGALHQAQHLGVSMHLVPLTTPLEHLREVLL